MSTPDPPTSSSDEPHARLRHGRKFEADITESWEESAQGAIRPQKGIVKPSGRKGYIDLHVSFEDDDTLVAVAEIKASNWDAMTATNLRRNVRRQIRQINSYIDSQLAEGKDVSVGVIFERRPADLDRLATIEAMFDDEGISVAWHDESIDERRNRS